MANQLVLQRSQILLLIRAVALVVATGTAGIAGASTRDMKACGAVEQPDGKLTIPPSVKASFDECIRKKGYYFPDERDAAAQNQPAGGQAGAKQQRAAKSQPEDLAGGSVADDFYRDSSAAIVNYSSFRTVVLKVHEVSVNDGHVFLTSLQVPETVTRQSKEMANKSGGGWDDWFKQTQQGVGNPYTNTYTVICAFPMKEFGSLKGATKGSTQTVQAKLRTFADKRIILDCKAT